MNNKIGFVETPLEIAELMIELANVDKNALILDSGCGKGVFLQALKNKGYNQVLGIEINKELYEYSSKKFGNEYTIILGDFLTYVFPHKFDLIIGNPPYVHFNQLPPDLAYNVKNLIRTSEGDIYYAFIIKSISLLKEGGELIYIVPYHFFYNTYAKLVREMLLKFGKIEIIIDLDETRLFNNENPETIIFKFKKGKYNLNNEKITLLNIKTRKTNSLEIYRYAIESLIYNKSNKVFDFVKISHYLSSDPWSTFIVNVPQFPSVRLKNFAKVGVGLVSGFDEPFIINKEQVDIEQNFNDYEINLIKKFVKGKHCNRFIIKGFELYVVIDDSINSEDELLQSCPNIYQKILPYKDEMLRRYLPPRRKWFQWQALRNYKFLISSLFQKRIYVPTLDRHPYNRFSLGDGGLLPSGDVLFIQPYDDKNLYFLLGYLNSTFFRKYYLAKGGRRGGRVSFTQKLLEDVEIPLFWDEVKDKIIDYTKEIIVNLHKGNKVSLLEKELDDLIYSAIEGQKFNSNYSTITTLINIEQQQLLL